MTRKLYRVLFMILLVLTVITTGCREVDTSDHFTLVLENGVASTSELDKPDSPMEWGKYHPKNLRDGDNATCWCEGEKDGYGVGATVYVSVPWHVDGMLIRNGYHKSKELYEKNSRVKKADIAFHVAVPVAGHVTQTGQEYTLYSTGEKTTVTFDDRMEEITFSPDVNYSKIIDLVKKLRDDKKKGPMGEMKLVAGLTINEVYQGSKYKDTCISEISFPYTKKPVINETQNAITVGEKKLVSDVDSVFQLVDTSPANYWAIVIRMPAKAEGRVETEYRLYYLPAMKRVMLNINSQSLTGFTDIYGKPVKKGEKVYLQLINKSGKEDTLLMNPYNLSQFIEKE